MVKFTEIPFFKKLVGFFKQGASPSGLAASTTIGIVLGILPVLGVTTWLSTLIGVRFRLNVPLILAVLYLVWPLQIGLVLPFLRTGEWLLGVPPFVFSVEKMQAAFEANFFEAMSEFGFVNLYALVGWGVFAVPLGVFFYYLLLVGLRFLMKKKSRYGATVSSK